MQILPLRIYVETKSTFPTFTELVSGFDLKNGPTPYAAVTHQEIVEQSRPKKLNASVGVTLTEGLKAAVLMYTQGKAFELLQAGMRELRDALGAAHVLTGADAEGHLTDQHRRLTGRALAVVRPADTAQVAQDEAALRVQAGPVDEIRVGLLDLRDERTRG